MLSTRNPFCVNKYIVWQIECCSEGVNKDVHMADIVYIAGFFFVIHRPTEVTISFKSI